MLTARQKRVYDWIAQRVMRGEPTPTFQEIADGLGMSKAGVANHLALIAAKGYITVDGRRIRLPHIAKLLSKRENVVAAAAGLMRGELEIRDLKRALNELERGGE